LRILIRHCQSPEVEGYTQSDFPLAHLSQRQLDLTIDRIRRERAARFRDIAEDIYELSPMQHGMLFHSLYAPNSAVYCVQTAFTIKGTLDVAAFERAWEQVIGRHSILRTAFAWEKLDHPVQIVYKRATMPIDYQDWRHLDETEVQARLDQYFDANGRAGFDLAKPPIMRLSLFRISDDAYQLVWTNHHLILDAWSGNLVFTEVFALYDSFSRGRPLNLPPVRPYRDYISWQQSQDSAVAERFWRELLKGFKSPVELTVDRGRVPARALAGFN
jgi:hypothetical protein